MTLDPALRMTLRAALALLWLAAVSHKLRDPLRFQTALGAYQLVPERSVRALAAVVIGFELALGFSLLLPTAGALPALATAALLTVYALAIALNLKRGRRALDCGCGARPQPIGEGLVARNAGLIALALLAALPASGRELLWLDAATIVGGAAALAALYAAVDAALASSARSVRAPA